MQGGPPPLLPPPGQQIAERTVSSVGGFMVAGQRVQIGRGYTHQVVTAHLDGKPSGSSTAKS
ncbi:hypothetical protein RKD32_001781 [Streptomyces sp. SAI-195]